MKPILAFALLCFATLGTCATFDFENEPVAGHASGVVFSDSGVNLTVRSAGGWVHVSSLAIADNQGTKSCFANARPDIAGNPFSPIDFTFDRDITNATLLAGDGGNDDDITISVTLFDANGVQVGNLVQPYGNTSHGISFQINQTFRRAVVDSDTPTNPHSIAAEWSSVTASPVPEPGLFGTLGVAPLLMNQAKRRKRLTT